MESGQEVLSNDKKRKFHLVVDLYCCEMSESRDRPGMKYGHTWHLRVQRLSPWDDIYEVKPVDVVRRKTWRRCIIMGIDCK